MAKVVGAVSDTLGEATGVLSAVVAVSVVAGGAVATELVVITGSGCAGLVCVTGLVGVLGLDTACGSGGVDTGAACGEGAGVKNSIVKSGRLRKGSSEGFRCHNAKAPPCTNSTATVVAATRGAVGVSWFDAVERDGLKIT
jgi:hypothetical protein